MPNRLLRKLLTRAAWISFCSSIIAASQAPQAGHTARSEMQQSYDAAYRLQASGDFVHADVEHKRFLAMALHHLANGYANTGDYARCVPLYDEALKLTPDNFDLLMDSAGASLEAHNVSRAKTLAQSAVDLNPARTSDFQKAKAHHMLGTALRDGNDEKAAIEQFKAAVVLQPSVDNIIALGNSTLDVGGREAGAIVFARVLNQFGDTAINHMKLGRAYAMAGLPEDGVREFKAAIAKDDQLVGVHYSLGATYLALAQPDNASAEAELFKEIALHPKDTFSCRLLGYLAFVRHDNVKAELYWKRNVRLNPRDADGLMDLGGLYVELNQSQDAILALRQAIAITPDPSHNNFAIEEAHFKLGRLLVANGDISEGKHELDIAQQQLVLKKQAEESRVSGKASAQSPLDRTRVPTQREVDELKALENVTGVLIAGSYNNLGVHAAMAGDFSSAAGYFESAAEWKPTLAGLDHNLGRAEFEAGRFALAIEPLSRFLKTNPSDAEARSMLAQIKAVQKNEGSH
jgi:tetratricopeptide (TPR) repeat protein